jgi:hypothetical protein
MQNNQSRRCLVSPRYSMMATDDLYNAPLARTASPPLPSVRALTATLQASPKEFVQIRNHECLQNRCRRE